MKNVACRDALTEFHNNIKYQIWRKIIFSNSEILSLPVQRVVEAKAGLLARLSSYDGFIFANILSPTPTGAQLKQDNSS